MAKEMDKYFITAIEKFKNSKKDYRAASAELLVKLSYYIGYLESKLKANCNDQ